MIFDGLMDRRHIQIVDRVVSWKEAVKISVDPLVENGHVYPRYYDAIIEAAKKHGPYFVLAPNLAMPHASYLDGVISKHISLVILKEPVRFSETSYDVRLIFTLAAEDNTSHLDALAKLSDLFQNQKKMDALTEANTVDDVIAILEQV